MAIDIPEFCMADKELSLTPDWTVWDSEWLSFAVPLEVKGATLAGFRLLGRTMLRHPDKHVVCQLAHHPMTDQGGAISRMEWRPFTGHNNMGRGPREFRHREITGSHQHCFDLNWRVDQKAVRRGILPLAVPIDPDPQNFREFLALVGKEFRISNIQRIGVPPWEASLV
jgi:hypothetical protein